MKVAATAGRKEDSLTTCLSSPINWQEEVMYNTCAENFDSCAFGSQNETPAPPMFLVERENNQTIRKLYQLKQLGLAREVHGINGSLHSHEPPSALTAAQKNDDVFERATFFERPSCMQLEVERAVL